ncbi:M14 family zinc carboxypeptidase [Botrimarina sp.]|uniref:M14 family zinc carboxypeptidase n=1 Tax=Botrimarina sp. TaxID=2795802 RepID=UPI0032EC1F94
MLDWDDLLPQCAYACPPGGWRPAAVAAAIESIRKNAAVEIDWTRLGESLQGRPIAMVTVGGGPTRVLLWSQIHGDEPTHTTALLNLLRLLTRADGSGERLRRGLTVGVVTPLNPDGAEHKTRHNAQGIDVNRDFRRFATAESQALRSAFEGFTPDYAFNLHNQPPRRAMPDPPRRPASASLQVPPVDADDTQTDSVRRAVQVAATFRRAIAPHCEGRVSRYPADWMPRASGDWSQARGVATVLVEAGGWPDHDFAAMERAHFAALVQTLDAIASTALGEPGGIDDADAADYTDLPRSSTRHLFDRVFAVGGVAQLGAEDIAVVGRGHIGVDFPDRTAGGDEPAAGSIAAIGDLEDEGGLSTVETPAIALPGRIVLAEAPESAFDDSPADWDTLARLGVTTTLVPINLADPAFEAAIVQAMHDVPPLHAALVARWDGPEPDAAEALDRLTVAISAGVVATLGEMPPLIAAAAERLGLSSLDPEAVPRRADGAPPTVSDWLLEVKRVAAALRLGRRGRIQLKAVADIALVRVDGDRIRDDSTEAVYVGGRRVLDADGLSPNSPGRWLRRHADGAADDR